eukprot:TRINITY_DN1247_c0_g1_i5.p3 TRINITY_DN1247_c0_g1~~TRINITY_DN1247_c0_g1_i5.p3  ORF type:complete len:106 (-),score=10.45 TRINITY_DN1247_c0_g1_i5:80-397(-)
MERDQHERLQEEERSQVVVMEYAYNTKGKCCFFPRGVEPCGHEIDTQPRRYFCPAHLRYAREQSVYAPLVEVHDANVRAAEEKRRQNKARAKPRQQKLQRSNWRT